jgi:hypothetical protein
VRGLETVADVKREAAALYRAARPGQVLAGDASRLATVLHLILRCVEGAELERRIEALEQARAGPASP